MGYCIESLPMDLPRMGHYCRPDSEDQVKEELTSVVCFVVVVVVAVVVVVVVVVVAVVVGFIADFWASGFPDRRLRLSI